MRSKFSSGVPNARNGRRGNHIPCLILLMEGSLFDTASDNSLPRAAVPDIISVKQVRS